MITFITSDNNFLRWYVGDAQPILQQDKGRRRTIVRIIATGGEIAYIKSNFPRLQATTPKRMKEQVWDGKGADYIFNNLY